MENKELLREEIIRVSGINPRKCMKCGKSSGTCPACNETE
jgi:heterodisulfide reductase subunit C